MFWNTVNWDILISRSLIYNLNGILAGYDWFFHTHVIFCNNETDHKEQLCSSMIYFFEFSMNKNISYTNLMTYISQPFLQKHFKLYYFLFITNSKQQLESSCHWHNRIIKGFASTFILFVLNETTSNQIRIWIMTFFWIGFNNVAIK